jgi:two-component sensor histidine kinase
MTSDAAGHRLRLRWAEHGVPIAQNAPRREGFGTELISKRVAYELQGTGTLEIQPGGAVCTLDFPLTDRTSILQTNEPGTPK